MEVDKLRDSAIKFINQTKYQYGFDLDYFIQRMKSLVLNGSIVIFVEEKEGSFISAIGFVVNQDLFADYRIMAEIFFYGENSGGLKCLKFAEKFATRAGIKQIVMATTLYNEERNSNYYTRLGYKRDSSTFRKELA